MIAGQPFYSAMDGLTQSYIFRQKLQMCESIILSRFVVDLRERHFQYWTPYSDMHPRKQNSKRSTYHQWCAFPTKKAMVTHSPYILPKYMFLNLSRVVICSTAPFSLCVYTLRFETATWINPLACAYFESWGSSVAYNGAHVCDQCPGEGEHDQNEVHALLFCQDHRVCELRKHSSFLFTPFFEDLSAARPFLMQQVNNQLVHGFLSQQNNKLLLFLSN